MAEVKEHKPFKQEIRDGLNPRLWRRRTKFSLGLSAVLIVVLIISAIRAPTDRIPHPGVILESIDDGRYEDALVALEGLEAIYAEESLDDDNIAWIAGHRGVVYLNLGRYAEGVDSLDRAISLDPEQSDYYNWRALNFFRLDRMTDAEADFTSALELDAENSQLYLDRGYFYLDTGNLDGAVEDGRTAINLAPANPLGYGLRADAYAAQGRPDVALFDLDTLVDLTPGDWRPYLTRARVKNVLGDAAGAIEDLDAALVVGPTQEGAAEIDMLREEFQAGR